nr:FHA domain-containing protein [Bdellovibrionales bacterium]
VNIGRTTGEIICGEDGRMSGKHAQISSEMVDNIQVAFVQDLGSKNRTIVNRSEIQPHQKTKIKLYCLLEIGDQKFVITENKNVNQLDLNEMIDKLLKKPLIQFESLEVGPPNPSPLVSLEETPQELVLKKENKIQQLQIEVASLETNAKSELLKLEEAKERIIVTAKLRKGELSRMILTLKTEVEESKAEIARVRAELEQKKKKIINLKDIPADTGEEEAAETSSEDLPE